MPLCAIREGRGSATREATMQEQRKGVPILEADFALYMARPRAAVGRHKGHALKLTSGAGGLFLACWVWPHYEGVLGTKARFEFLPARALPYAPKLLSCLALLPKFPMKIKMKDHRLHAVLTCVGSRLFVFISSTMRFS